MESAPEIDNESLTTTPYLAGGGEKTIRLFSPAGRQCSSPSCCLTRLKNCISPKSRFRPWNALIGHGSRDSSLSFRMTGSHPTFPSPSLESSPAALAQKQSPQDSQHRHDVPLPCQGQS
jgi:hypothetical protein